MTLSILPSVRNSSGQDLLEAWRHPDFGLPVVGMSSLVNMAYAGRDLAPVLDHLSARYAADNDDASALFDISIILQVWGQRDKALELQKLALQQRRCFRRIHGNGTGLRILAFVTDGDFMANTPIDFLLEGSNAELWLCFVDAETGIPADLPDHDVAFVAVGESARNAAVLARLGDLLKAWPVPVLNHRTAAISGLTRTGVSALLANEYAIHSPINVKASRAALQRVALGRLPIAGLLLGQDFPVVVRPHDTHAGTGFCRLDSAAALQTYLEERPEADFNLAPFVAYQGSDGLFRKQRIAFIGGKAYASHLAVSSHWMVHYLSAEMETREERRAEEAFWMESFERGFAVRHKAAFDALVRLTGLDYFGIDCAEMPDGRLLLFEVDVAMIVHAMDSGDLFPYKKPAMQKLFRAFYRLFEDAVHNHQPASQTA